MNLRKCIKSFNYALNGIRLVLKENNARFHLLSTILVLLVAFYLQLEAGEWLWILAAITLIWVTETINTAIERVVDLVSPKIHPLAGQAKDLAAGAVVFAAIFAGLIALVIFIPKFVAIF